MVGVCRVPFVCVCECFFCVVLCGCGCCCYCLIRGFVDVVVLFIVSLLFLCVLFLGGVCVDLLCACLFCFVCCLCVAFVFVIVC